MNVSVGACVLMGRGVGVIVGVSAIVGAVVAVDVLGSVRVTVG